MKKYKNITAAMLLILILGTAFYITANVFYNREKESCLTILKEQASRLAEVLRDSFDQDREHLQLLADILSRQDTIGPDSLNEYLPLFENFGLMSDIQLLFPGDQILGIDGKLTDMTGILSYASESALGRHVTEITTDPENPEKKMVRSFVPVRKGRETAAMLYGSIELERLKTMYCPGIFGEDAQIYIIDGANEDFLLDTWHGYTANAGDWEKHKLKEGYSRERWYADLAEGTAGTIVGYSELADTFFYCSYEPVGINQWMLMLLVPEGTAFRQVEHIIKVSVYLAIVIGVILLIYFVWMLITVKKEIVIKENQLNRVSYMFHVEKILFDVQEKPEQMEKALKEVADTVKAGLVFLYFCDEEMPKRLCWVWSGSGNEEFRRKLKFADVPFSGIWELLKEGSFVAYHMEALEKKYLDLFEPAIRSGLNNLMLTPVLDSDGKSNGILGACNMSYTWETAEQLECVSLSFAMAANNIRVYQKMKQMGMYDSLTGLLNRNSYHTAIEKLKVRELSSLACIYMDANGLHELNNCLGHEAGDQMLQYIAGLLKDVFGEENTYRIGGDEFVVTCINLPKKEVLRRAEEVRKAAEHEKYCISIGIEWRSSNLNISRMIRLAEERMKQDKQRYYEKKGDIRKIREMNEQLEQILLEKKDAETFLSVIACNFKGVYFVDLNADCVRHLYIPEYFERMLKRTNGKFSQAMLLYAKEETKPEYYDEFLQFCDYQQLEELLEENVPEFVYQKRDGTWMKLKVFKFAKNSANCFETLWIFENTAPLE